MKPVALVYACAVLILATACRSSAGAPAPDAQGAGVPRSPEAPDAAASAAPDAAASAPSAGPADSEGYLHERVASHDGRFFAVSEYDRSIRRSTLRLESSDGSPARVLVDLRAFRVKGSSLDPEIEAAAREILFPRWSPDDSNVYFLVNAWGTDHALYAVDVRTGNVKFLSASNKLLVLDDCANPLVRGALVVAPHHGGPLLHFHGVDPLDWLFLLDATGKLLGPISSVDRFRSMYCASGKDAPVPLPQKAPRLRQLVCRERVFRAHTFYFLDGGTATEYYSQGEEGFGPDWGAPEYLEKYCPWKLKE